MMKRFLLLSIVFSTLVPICGGQSLVYTMYCLESVFDANDPCPVKEPAAVYGFVALDVDLDGLAALNCGEYIWTINTAVVRFGWREHCLWRCTEYPLVRIYRLAGDRICIFTDSFEAAQAGVDILNEDPNDPNGIPVPGSGEPNEPNTPPEVNLPEGTIGENFTCIIDGRVPNTVIGLGGGFEASVPWIFSGTCMYNGNRFKGSGVCGLWLNVPMTRLANNTLSTPQGTIDWIIDRWLFMYHDLGTCSDPNQECFGG
jgi:hypothetical protein